MFVIFLSFCVVFAFQLFMFDCEILLKLKENFLHFLKCLIHLNLILWLWNLLLSYSFLFSLSNTKIHKKSERKNIKQKKRKIEKNRSFSFFKMKKFFLCFFDLFWWRETRKICIEMNNNNNTIKFKILKNKKNLFFSLSIFFLKSFLCLFQKIFILFINYIKVSMFLLQVENKATFFVIFIIVVIRICSLSFIASNLRTQKKLSMSFSPLFDNDNDRFKR